MAVLALGFGNEGWAVRRPSPSPAGQLIAKWNKALRGEGIKQDSTCWVTILRLLLPSKAAFWPPKLHFGKKWGGEDVSW